MPSTPREWACVAAERGKDAASLKGSGRDLAAAYMIGYAVECELKALLHALNKRFPTAGPHGHNLQGLWELAGMKITDIHEYRRAFIRDWNTDLRYERSMPKSRLDELFEGGKQLCGYIQRRFRRNSWRNSWRSTRR